MNTSYFSFYLPGKEVWTNKYSVYIFGTYHFSILLLVFLEIKIDYFKFFSIDFIMMVLVFS